MAVAAVKTRGTQFIKVPFALLENGAIHVLGARSFAVYQILLRYIWRGYNEQHPKIQKLQRAGKVVSVVSQQKVATLAGISRQSVCIACKQLSEFKWIRPVTLQGNNRAYVVGEYEGSRRRRVEHLFAMRQVEKALRPIRGTTREARVQARLEAVRRHFKRVRAKEMSRHVTSD